MTEFWQADTIVSPPPAPATAVGDWWTKDKVVAAAPASGGPMSWSDVASQAWRNTPSSAMKFGKDLVSPILHPIDTATSIKNVGEGVLEKAGIMSGTAEIPYADAVGQHYKDRYGSVEGFKRALASDPIGVAGDASVALTGGGSVLARAPGVIGKVGEIARGAGDALNPLSAIAKPIDASVSASRTRAATVPSTEDLFDAATDAYHHPAIKDLVVKPSSIQTWRDQTHISLNDEGFDDVLAPKTFGVLSRLDPPPGGYITGQSLNTLRKKLGTLARGADPTERAASSHAIDALDGYASSIPPTDILRGDPAKVAGALTEARGNYAAAKRSQAIEEAMDKAALQAGASNSGMNVDNATRQRLKDILSNPKRRRGFSDDELTQMRKVVVGSTPANLARRAGNMLGGGGGLGTVITSAAGGAAAGTLGSFAPLVGYGFKKLSAALSGKDVQSLQDAVRSRSPLGKQMQSTMSKWGHAAVLANRSPTAQNIARLTLASKNLSTNLIDAGIGVTPETLTNSASENPKRTRGNVTVD